MHFHQEKTLSRSSKIVLTSIGLCLLAACSNNKSELEQLAELRQGLVYRHYRALSENGLRPGLVSLDKALVWAGSVKPELKTAPLEFTSDDLCVARLMLSYSALSTGKTTPALAEADITSDGPCPQLISAGASTLRAIIFQRSNWPGLAKQEQDAALKLIPPNAKGMSAEEQLTVFHTLMLITHMQDGKPEQAVVHLDAIALLLKEPWLGKIGRAALTLKQGDLTGGLRELKRLSEDPSTPPEIRELLANEIAKLEASTGSVDSSLFQVRLLTLLMRHALKDHSPKYAIMIAYADKQVGEQLDSGISQAKGWLGEALQKAKTVAP